MLLRHVHELNEHARTIRQVGSENTLSSHLDHRSQRQHSSTSSQSTALRVHVHCRRFEFKMCTQKSAHIHPHGSRAVIRIHRARSGVAELRKSAGVAELRKSAGVAELRKSARVAELKNCKPEQLSFEDPLESPSSRTANRSRRTPRVLQMSRRAPGAVRSETESSEQTHRDRRV